MLHLLAGDADLGDSTKFRALSSNTVIGVLLVGKDPLTNALADVEELSITRITQGIDVVAERSGNLEGNAILIAHVGLSISARDLIRQASRSNAPGSRITGIPPLAATSRLVIRSISSHLTTAVESCGYLYSFPGLR